MFRHNRQWLCGDHDDASLIAIAEDSQPYVMQQTVKVHHGLLSGPELVPVAVQGTATDIFLACVDSISTFHAYATTGYTFVLRGLTG